MTTTQEECNACYTQPAYEICDAIESIFPQEITLYLLSFLSNKDWNSLSLVCRPSSFSLVRLASHNLLWRDVLQQVVWKDMVSYDTMCQEYKSWMQEAKRIIIQSYRLNIFACKNMLIARKGIASQVESRLLQQSKQLIQKLKHEDAWLRFYEGVDELLPQSEKDHANRCKVIVFEQDVHLVKTIIEHSEKQSHSSNSLYSSNALIYDSHHLEHYSINSNKQVALEMVSATPLELEQISADFSFEMDKSNYSQFVDTNLFVVLFSVSNWDYFSQIWSKYIARIKGNSPHAKIILVGYATETRNVQQSLHLLKEKAAVPISHFMASEISKQLHCEYYELHSNGKAETVALFQQIMSDYFYDKEKETKKMCSIQ